MPYSYVKFVTVTTHTHTHCIVSVKHFSILFNGFFRLHVIINIQ